MAFNTTSITKFGVFPAKGGYSCSESKNGEAIEKEFTFNYVLLGSPDTSSQYYYANDAAAKVAFVNFIYATYGAEPYYRDGSAETDPEYPLSAISIQLNSDYEYRWDCSCTFKNLNDEEQSEDETPTTDPIIGTTDIKYALGTGNTHITRSLSSTAEYIMPGWTQTDFGNRIDYNDGETKGVDVITPQLTFQIAANFSELTSTDMQIIMGMVGSVNNTTWGPFAEGTVLFRGGDFTAEKWNKDNEYDGIYWKVTFNFEFSPSTIVTKPDQTTFTKGGWEYVWSYRNKVLLNNIVTDQVVQINKEVVYPSSDFSYLGITWRS